MAAKASASSAVQVRVQRSIEDKDYGREEYIESRIDQLMKKGEVFISMGTHGDLSDEIPVIKEKFGKYSYFPGFVDAEAEIIQKVQAQGLKIKVEPLFGGADGDMFGFDPGTNQYGSQLILMRPKQETPQERKSGT